ncbi:helix-turn-helix transcriptional regulator [Desertibacillus haloalkaliphilus]|uniref:helix-turn-helix transcriptional regulator n=1 Tax=Desertibacillus haloalkaliphilus TaxID=1328930 RepID=UPI001C27D032|nr:helix-turn-helix domain-containing protein [Desertibacillus haloalkaliphilus]MBU8906339.1 AraC family transcriptional regulator [Desertibacillus haloalkaliphilus]
MNKPSSLKEVTKHLEELEVNYRIQGSFGVTLDYHSHQEYEIYMLHAGSCRYLIHNQIYDLEPGDILLMDGLAQHRPNVSDESEYIRSIIHFSPKWICGLIDEMRCHYLLEAFERFHHCLIRPSENEESSQLESVIQRMALLQESSQRRDIQTQTELKVLLLQALIIIYRLSKLKDKPIAPKKEAKAEHAENIAAYVQVNFKHKLTIVDISKNLNLSKSYVSHVFKEITGYTVMGYLMECRLRQVKYSLEMEPDKPIKDIAYDCGFESVAHFSRYFKKKVGMTAREYRTVRLDGI